MAESLKYTRGNLTVLDQLLLPHETKYLPVLGVHDAWTVIRTMQVRGAPLIAIVAVLGLAVELENRRAELIQSKPDLLKFLNESIEYLRTSRPTAVNLFNAMDELTLLVKNAAAAEEVTSEATLDQVIAASEQLFAEDIETNRAIGFHGAKRILELVQRDKIRVLTICNTGSLATAGFGTALGVVRALHELGKLEHVYACETRPYNQGARLTAYEIVQDRLPGTLITDNMASALMAVKGVDVVVIGADRVAGNGDTANKIGSYQLAIAADYHRIPFFTALPTTTIDVTMASGIEIHVEERPAHELTSIFGQKIAPDGINVWNPAFDVTPCALITGVITELGVIEPEHTLQTNASTNSDRIIPVASFLQRHCASNPAKYRQLLTRLEKAVQPIATPIGYARMDFHHIKQYIAQQGLLTQRLQLTAEDIAELQAATSAEDSEKGVLKVAEIGDGNLNFVYIVTGRNNSQLILKQALPYVRCIGEAWPMTLERASFECQALKKQYELTQGQFVPEIYHFDFAKAIIAMQYIEAPHLILRKAMMEKQRFSTLAQDLGVFAAKTLFGTSLLALSGGEFRRAVSAWSRNIALCALTEKVIFTDPYTNSVLNHWSTSPALDSVVQSIQSNHALKHAVAFFKNKFLTNTQALVHGDLHTGSVMVKEGSTYVIDPEFAFYGPMGFDIGQILANMFFSYFAHASYSSSSSDSASADYAQWVAATMVSFHRAFETHFIDLWNQQLRTTQGSGELYVSGVYDVTAFAEVQREYLQELWRDSVGFAGAEMVRRVIGVAHVADLESIVDVAQRNRAEIGVLRLAQELLLTAHRNNNDNNGNGLVQDVEALVALAKTFVQ